MAALLQGQNQQPDTTVAKQLTKEENPKFTDIDTIIKEHKPEEVVGDDSTQKDQLASFARKVVLLLHTCNDNEFWAVVEKLALDPPTGDENEKLSKNDRSVFYPEAWCVIGMFARYRTVVVKTRQGNECIAPLTKALCQPYFPNVQVIIGVGIAYARDKKLKYPDVIISSQIENCVQVKFDNGAIINRGPRPPVRDTVEKAFCTSELQSWRVSTEGNEPFYCTQDDSRRSSAYVGSIISAPWLVRDSQLKEKLFEDPNSNAKGGEMEGWALLEVQKMCTNVAVIIIKGVADYGDSKKEDKWQLTAAKAAVACTHYCLMKTGGRSFKAQEIEEKETSMKSLFQQKMRSIIKNVLERVVTLNNQTAMTLTLDEALDRVLLDTALVSRFKDLSDEVASLSLESGVTNAGQKYDKISDPGINSQKKLRK